MSDSTNQSLSLEIGLTPDEENRYQVDLRFTDPTNEAERRPVRGECALDDQYLSTLELNPQDYGKALAQMLFRDDAIRKEYAYAKSVLGSKDREVNFLRIKLMFSSTAEKLHGLRWELLTDPDDESRIATSEKILFSRFIQSQDWRNIRLRPKTELTALIAVAAPSNLADYHLASIKVADEITRVRQALPDMTLTVLGQDQPLTLNRLFEELRQRPVDILYLVCHGELIRDKQSPESHKIPRLFLQQEDGTTVRVDGKDLAQRLKELQQQPRLIVLASCESAGTPNDAILTEGVRISLAPLLADAGVPAIIAMRGKITMETIEKAMPVFFKQLTQDGQIDRALAVARGQVRERPDSWMLALFLRLREGRIWYVPGFTGEKSEFEQWRSICGFVNGGKVVPIIGPDLAEHLYGTMQELAQELAGKNGFPLSDYDKMDLAKVTQYISIKDSPEAAKLEVKNALFSNLQGTTKQLTGAEPPARPKELWPILIDGLWKNEHDPYRILAECNAGIYVSANAVPLLDKFLEKSGKSPQPLITQWRDERRAETEFYPDPKPDKPYVYYVYGRVDNDTTWVLTEDDFFDYLIRSSLYYTLMPDVIGKALTSNSLLFLGFNLNDWKFRILLRMITAKGGSSNLRNYNHVGVQVNPDYHTLTDIERFKRYLKKYFDQVKIDIYWGTAADFLKELSIQLKHYPSSGDWS
ncbi:MAG: CHAT domain-containing protein [Candidatus Competibacteraceae bacterium]